MHAGFGAAVPLGARDRLGLTAHVVREDADSEVIPSFAAEFLHEFPSGLEIKAAGFTYVPVADQSAWASGLRATQRFTLNDHVTVAPFFGPTYARVRARDAVAGAIRAVDHLMFFGGVSVHAERMEVTIFGSHSVFSRDPRDLDTAVDLEEMTHFAAYENNDGFARHSVGFEASYSILPSLQVSVRYAAIIYDDDTAHALALVPSVQVTRRLKVFGGVQFLRREENPNDLSLLGMSLSF